MTPENASANNFITASKILDRFVSEHNMRRTPERYAILERVADINRHFSVDELYEAMETTGYHVSRATVYSAVQLFVDAGVIRRHKFAGQQSKYELAVESSRPNHLHLICLQCGKIKEAKDPKLAQAIETAQFRAFAPCYHTLYLYGVCSACKRKAMKSNKTK